MVDILSVKATEVKVVSHPDGLKGWKAARLEYNDHVGYCRFMSSLWLPPNANIDELEALFDKWQG